MHLFNEMRNQLDMIALKYNSPEIFNNENWFVKNYGVNLNYNQITYKIYFSEKKTRKADSVNNINTILKKYNETFYKNILFMCEKCGGRILDVSLKQDKAVDTVRFTIRVEQTTDSEDQVIDICKNINLSKCESSIRHMSRELKSSCGIRDNPLFAVGFEDKKASPNKVRIYWGLWKKELMFDWHTNIENHKDDDEIMIKICNILKLQGTTHNSVTNIQRELCSAGMYLDFIGIDYGDETKYKIYFRAYNSVDVDLVFAILSVVSVLKKDDLLSFKQQLTDDFALDCLAINFTETSVEGIQIYLKDCNNEYDV